MALLLSSVSDTSDGTAAVSDGTAVGDASDLVGAILTRTVLPWTWSVLLLVMPRTVLLLRRTWSVLSALLPRTWSELY